MIPDSAILDRAVIGTLIAQLAHEQQDLVHSLTTTSSPSISSDYEAWLRIRTDIELVQTKLEKLLEKAQQNAPGSFKVDSDTARLSLLEARETHRILTQLDDVAQSLSSLEGGSAVDSLAKDAKTLVELRRMLKDLGKEERSGLKIISALKARRTELQSALSGRIEQEWKVLIAVTREGIRLPVPEGSGPFASHLVDLIAAAICLQTFPQLVKDLAHKLIQEIILPLANGIATSAVTTQGEENLLEILSASNSEESDPITEVPTAARLTELCTVFSFLQENLFVMDDEMNLVLARALGGELGRKLVDIVKIECIEGTLPADFALFQPAKTDIVAAFSRLKHILLESAFIPASAEEWHLDCQSLECLYASKSGRELLIKARRSFISEGSFLTVKKIEADGTLAEDDLTFFRLQGLSVSSAVADVLDDCRRLLGWASSAEYLRLAVSVIYNVCSLLLDIVPYSFQDRLISKPTAAALYLTSCIYASHQLAIFNRVIQKTSQAFDDGQTNWKICLLDAILRLRKKAYELLNVVTALSSKEVLEAITNGQAAWLVKLAQNQLQNLLEQTALKRGLEVLEKLATIWRGILPPVVFQQTIGSILDAVLVDAMSRVIAVEDINASDSSTLCTNFRWLLLQSSELLRVGDAAAEQAPFKYVPSWMRFQEIIFVLDASMNEIAERWADHNGPLAEHLLPEELKSLIRALFENNDKRARLLAGIK